MIARLSWTLRCLGYALLGSLILAAGLVFWTWHRATPLPLPTPAQQELVVLLQPSPLTCDLDDPEHLSGFEHDLIEQFAGELGVGVRRIIATPGDFWKQLEAHQVHLATAWLSPEDKPEVSFSQAFMESHDVLVQHEASLPIERIEELGNRTVHVLAGSRQAAKARQLKEKIASLQIVELDKGSPLDLLESVAAQRHELALVDALQFDVALQFSPVLQSSLEIGGPQPIVWAFPKNAHPELIRQANEFLARMQKTSLFAQLKDRYFGHIHRLGHTEIGSFIELSKTRLPKLRPFFQDAQTVTGIDWRLLAALAYQESTWDPNATSPTGVRGMMMLTEETADRLGISNRLDPKESILAGARYLNMLRDDIPAETPEPDRTWMALAAYNIGPGHFRAALTIGRQLKADTRAWHEMKRILPLLAKPKYYERLKAGRARGGEAVILAENVRNYYDILKRHEAPYRSGDIEQLEVLPVPGLNVRPAAKNQAGPIRSLPPR
ncbi:MAG: Membrane-bound lytic murein transglycosylase F precursor [Betaproteobacteria bacterium ADurb.Bin341]|nr:MAG: Membrane-bound lytic murein transglycosylase F precursor [Betaproteobacteria bacterium ADurb.Bin341]